MEANPDMQEKEEAKCWGIIAIKETNKSYVQMYKEGDEPDSTYLHREDEHLKKDADKRMQDVVKAIKKKKLFHKDGQMVVNELIISATESYEDQEHIFLSLANPPLLSSKIHFVSLPEQSNLPIRDTIKNYFPGMSFKTQTAKHENKYERSHSTGSEVHQSRSVLTKAALFENNLNPARGSDVDKDKPVETQIGIYKNNSYPTSGSDAEQGSQNKRRDSSSSNFSKHGETGSQNKRRDSSPSKQKESYVKKAKNLLNINKKNNAKSSSPLIQVEHVDHKPKSEDKEDKEANSKRGSPGSDTSLPMDNNSNEEMLQKLNESNTKLVEQNTKLVEQNKIMIEKNTQLVDQVTILIDKSERIEEKLTKNEENVTIDRTGQDNLIVVDEPKDGLHQHDTIKGSKKSRAPPKPAMYDLSCFFSEAPSRVQQIKDEFTDNLKERLNKEMFQLVEDSSGPTVAFAVNNSRIESDIKRDFKPDTSAGPIFLLVIKTTNKPEEKLEKIFLDQYGCERLRETAFLLVNTNNTHLLSCDTNNRSFKNVIKFLRGNSEKGSRL